MQQKEKWNEAVNYMIKVLAAGEQTKASSVDYYALDGLRQAIGANDNYNTTPNTRQYQYVPDYVTVEGSILESNMGR